MKKSKKSKWTKIRSGRRILGRIHHVGSGTYAWEGLSTRGARDRGISGDRNRAIDNVLRDAGGDTGTADGFRRQYEVSVEDD